MRDTAAELLSIELTSGSRGVPLVARSRTTHRRTHPAVAVLRLPLDAAVAPVMVAPGIVGPIIAPIVQVALALAYAWSVVAVAPLNVPPVMMRPSFASQWLVAPALSCVWLSVPSLLAATAPRVVVAAPLVMPPVSVRLSLPTLVAPSHLIPPRLIARSRPPSRLAPPSPLFASVLGALLLITPATLLAPIGVAYSNEA
ncbi:hypothetical protein EMIHUDRAFT_254394 [Emiliania huxleyi CCMP1516]|uniref:Uncharacterized protein n=2 Tax=Emiliania huxleyi TaxID=2903 RepID=A0A0D3JTP0_EMIH1|nr:hypothetical protein EMIHUDRAFT_254394 [Emiliania huxleyi CCMP1516]EOD26875.1 hypothetical protein EMIHUDRAFT_254394 [Emiliania huxleyi CCMP1516]|eukprot:XP_005779304.1 hypothetical protein EMIHUDRAFT_254394 [Emiliania huxleyi CCMP1516]